MPTFLSKLNFSSHFLGEYLIFLISILFDLGLRLISEANEARVAKNRCFRAQVKLCSDKLGMMTTRLQLIFVKASAQFNMNFKLIGGP